MEFIYAIAILLAFMSLTNWAAAFLGKYLSIIFIILSVLLCSNYIIFGLGGLLGNALNIIITQKYINKNGVMSQAPRQSVAASIWYLFIFIIITLIKYVFKVDINGNNIWHFYVGGIFIWLIDPLFSSQKKKQSLDDYFDSIIKYKVLEKYQDDPKWAIYLYFNDGHEGWNKTIKGSFRAKHPTNDLTFVFETKEQALDYCEFNFRNAKCINSETE